MLRPYRLLPTPLYRGFSKDVLRVDPNGNGDHQTIAAANTAASSGDTILVMPGSYAEGITLKAGVNLIGIDPHNCIIAPTGSTHAVQFSSGTGNYIANLSFSTASGSCLIRSSASGDINVENCIFNSTSAALVLTIGSGTMRLVNCEFGSIASTAGLLVASSGILKLDGCRTAFGGSSITGASLRAFIVVSSGGELHVNKCDFNIIRATDAGGVAMMLTSSSGTVDINTEFNTFDITANNNDAYGLRRTGTGTTAWNTSWDRFALSSTGTNNGRISNGNATGTTTVNVLGGDPTDTSADHVATGVTINDRANNGWY